MGRGRREFTFLGEAGSGASALNQSRTVAGYVPRSSAREQAFGDVQLPALRPKLHAREMKPPVIIGRDEGGRGQRGEMPCTPPARPLRTAP
jgi:hypothetical protein